PPARRQHSSRSRDRGTPYPVQLLGPVVGSEVPFVCISSPAPVAPKEDLAARLAIQEFQYARTTLARQPWKVVERAGGAWGGSRWCLRAARICAHPQTL